jgi:hypothetical protein
VVKVFKKLFVAKFPIEEMRVVSREELDAEPTGDGNNTTAFVCRRGRKQKRWSDHATGQAIDINPFQNPYHREDIVLPELASAYVDRTRERRGMIRRGDVVQSAFRDIGWRWGGLWAKTKDLMHVSKSGM